MAPNVGDIVQITDVQTYLGQTVLNVYFYELTAMESAVDYADIAEAFDNVVRQELLPAQVDGLVHTNILVKNLTNGVDIWDQVDAVAGANTAGDDTPSFTALGFRLVRSTALTRHGSKRIAGVPENAISGNTETYGGTTIADIEAALGAPIERSGTVDHDVTAIPVIVGRIPEGDPGAGGLDLSKINPVASAQFIRVTTQTTRRAGRGV